MSDPKEAFSPELIQKIKCLPDSQQYSYLYDALEHLLEWEDNKEILVIIAAQLSELAKMALEKSGYSIFSGLNRSVH